MNFSVFVLIFVNSYALYVPGKVEAYVCVDNLLKEADSPYTRCSLPAAVRTAGVCRVRRPHGAGCSEIVGRNPRRTRRGNRRESGAISSPSEGRSGRVRGCPASDRYDAGCSEIVGENPTGNRRGSRLVLRQSASWKAASSCSFLTQAEPSVRQRPPVPTGENIGIPHSATRFGEFRLFGLRLFREVSLGIALQRADVQIWLGVPACAIAVRGRPDLPRLEAEHVASFIGRSHLQAEAFDDAARLSHLLGTFSPSLAVRPGAMQLTRMPSGARSTATVRVTPITPARVRCCAQYRACPDQPPSQGWCR